MRRLWGSSTLRSVAAYAAAGVGFAGANLMLARTLPLAEYALITLVVALFHLGFALAPGGVDGIVNRRRLEAGPRLLRRVLLAGTLVASGLATLGVAAYGLPIPYAAMIFVSVTAGGALMVAMAQLQSEQRFGLSLALNQSPNLVLLLGAVVSVAIHTQRAWPTLLVSTAGWVVAAVYGWMVLFRERHAKPHRSGDFPWSEAVPIAGVLGIELLLIQMERLVIPHVLPLGDLATFGVLAAVAGSLFRALQQGVGYSLLPRLRAATGVQARRSLLIRETRLVAALAILGAAALWIVIPLVERWPLQGKYVLSGPLLVAAIVSGTAKILDAFSRATATALATARELSTLSLLGLASAGIAIAAAVVGARWGLPGVIYGVAFGWTVRAASALFVAARHLRAPAVSP